MKYKLNIINGVIDDFSQIISFFFIYPRFRLEEGSCLSRHVNKLINSKIIGDGILKLNFKEEISYKYLNGILHIYVYDKNEGFKMDDRIEHFQVILNMKDGRGCFNCDFNIGDICELFQGKIKYPKYICDFWEEV